MRSLLLIKRETEGLMRDSGGIRGRDLFKTNQAARPGYVLANKAATNVKPDGART